MDVDDPMTGPVPSSMWIPHGSSSSPRGAPSASSPSGQQAAFPVGVGSPISLSSPNKYRCECGTVFTRSQEKASHCKHCRVHIAFKLEQRALVQPSGGQLSQSSASSSPSSPLSSSPQQQHFPDSFLMSQRQSPLSSSARASYTPYAEMVPQGALQTSWPNVARPTTYPSGSPGSSSSSSSSAAAAGQYLQVPHHQQQQGEDSDQMLRRKLRRSASLTTTPESLGVTMAASTGSPGVGRRSYSPSVGVAMLPGMMGALQLNSPGHEPTSRGLSPHRHHQQQQHRQFLNLSAPNRPPDLPASASALFGAGPNNCGDSPKFVGTQPETPSSPMAMNSPVPLLAPLNMDAAAQAQAQAQQQASLKAPMATLSTTMRGFGRQGQGGPGPGEQDLRRQAHWQNLQQLSAGISASASVNGSHLSEMTVDTPSLLSATFATSRTAPHSSFPGPPENFSMSLCETAPAAFVTPPEPHEALNAAPQPPTSQPVPPSPGSASRMDINFIIS